MRAGNYDEAYRLSRSVVECALILRYVTSDNTLQNDRAKKFFMFSWEYKTYGSIMLEINSPVSLRWWLP